MVEITDDVHRATVLADGGGPQDTVAGICPNRFRGCLRKSVPAVCPLRPRGTALVATSPLRNVVPRRGFGSDYGQGLDMFIRWFEYRFHSMLVDLCDGPLIHEEI